MHCNIYAHIQITQMTYESLLLHSREERMSFRFRMTWRWVNYDNYLFLSGLSSSNWPIGHPPPLPPLVTVASESLRKTNGVAHCLTITAAVRKPCLTVFCTILDTEGHQKSTWLSLWLSLLSTCSWCVVRAYTWLSLWLSLLSTCSWCVVSAYTWLALWLSLLSTCSWCVVIAYTWLALWLSLLSTCSWCVVVLWQPLHHPSGYCTLVVFDERPPPPPHMIEKRFGCTAIHNKSTI